MKQTSDVFTEDLFDVGLFHAAGIPSWRYRYEGFGDVVLDSVLYFGTPEYEEFMKE